MALASNRLGHEGFVCACAKTELVEAVIDARAAERRKSRFVNMRASIRHKMRNRHRLGKSDLKLDLSCMSKYEQSLALAWRLAAFEKVNQKPLASTKSRRECPIHVWVWPIASVSAAQRHVRSAAQTGSHRLR